MELGAESPRQEVVLDRPRSSPRQYGLLQNKPVEHQPLAKMVIVIIVTMIIIMIYGGE